MKLAPIVALLAASLALQGDTKIILGQVFVPTPLGASVLVIAPTTAGGIGTIVPAAIDPATLVLDMSSPAAPVLRAIVPGASGIDVVGERHAISAETTVMPLGKPAPISKLAVYRNGIRLGLTDDYTLAANVVTFGNTTHPLAGDVVLADYHSGN